jgi:hypothetical protein
VLASNVAFTDFLERRLRTQRRRRTRRQAGVDRGAEPADRDAIGRQLRDRVEREHSVDTWAAACCWQPDRSR